MPAVARRLRVAASLLALLGADEVFGQTGMCDYAAMMQIMEQQNALSGQSLFADSMEKCLAAQQVVELQEQQLQLAQACGDRVNIIKANGLMRMMRSAAVTACDDTQDFGE